MMRSTGHPGLLQVARRWPRWAAPSCLFPRRAPPCGIKALPFFALQAALWLPLHSAVGQADTIRDPAAALDRLAIDSRVRIRVMTTDSSHFADLTGRLSANRNTTFEVTDDRGKRSVLSVPLIKQVSIWTSTRTHGVIGLGLGLLAGGAAGLLVGRRSQPPCQCGVATLDVAVSAIMGTGLGGALGFAVGGNITTDTWSVIAP